MELVAFELKSCISSTSPFFTRANSFNLDGEVGWSPVGEGVRVSCRMNIACSASGEGPRGSKSTVGPLTSNL